MNKRNDFLPAQKTELFERHCDVFFQGFEKKANPGPVNPDPRGKPGSPDFYSFCRGELATDEKGRNYNADEEDVDKLSKFATGRKTGHSVLFSDFFILMFPIRLKNLILVRLTV